VVNAKAPGGSTPVAEFGAYMLTNAREGHLGFTGHYLPKPGGSEEIYREDYFTRVGDLTCGAGYYTTKTE
jgi:hypothetical protein